MVAVIALFFLADRFKNTSVIFRLWVIEEIISSSLEFVYFEVAVPHLLHRAMEARAAKRQDTVKATAAKKIEVEVNDQDSQSELRPSMVKVNDSVASVRGSVAHRETEFEIMKFKVY